jgi:N utilization substance protein A
VRGTRIKSIIDEVKGEKIDIIPWSDVPETLLAASLKPAEIHQITLVEGLHTKRATVVVPEDQLSLAIGWKGQNVRLAVKMTGWDIDIVPPELTAEQKAAAEAKAAAAALAAAEALAASEAPGVVEAQAADSPGTEEASTDAEASADAEPVTSGEAEAPVELAEEQSETE